MRSPTDIQRGQAVGALSSLKRFGQGPSWSPVATGKGRAKGGGRGREEIVQEKKKSVSSSTEKKRKDKIRYWINKIGEQLPPVENPDKDRVGRSTLEIVEKAWSYIVQLKEAADPTCRDKIRNTYLDEIKKLKNDLEYWKQQAYKLHQKLETAENPPTSAVNQPQNTIPQSTTSTTEKLTNTTEGTNDNSTSVKDSEKSKSKTKRRNTISLQLENLKKQQQENANSMNSMQQQQQGNQELLAPGMMNNFPTMMDGGATANQQQVFNQQQMLMNSMIFGGGSGGVMVPNSNGGMVLTNTALGSHGNNTGMVVNGSVGGGSGISLQGNQIQGQSSEAKGQSAAEAGAGLLQLAMQDAGITPSSQSAPSEDQNVTNVSSVSMATGSNSDTQPSALHTLASIASNTQSLSNASQVPASQVQVNSLVTQGGSSAPTATTQSINSSAPIMATGQGQGGINATMSNNGTMMNMSFMNGQQMQPGNMMPGGQNPGFNPMAATQQIMFVNDQGVPCVANIPMGIDPASLGIPNNAKQVMGIDKSGNVIVQNLQKDQGQINQMNEQAILANTLAQQQMNLALQGQMPGQFQGQNNVAIGNPAALVQPSMNNQLQLNQQMMQPMGGQLASGQLTQTNQGLILPASQTGNLLTVNSVPTQQSQLPQALLLPNGQIIPVVSNPNLVAGQQGQMASMMPPNPQQITGGNIQQRLPLPAGMVQGDPNNQVIMTSSGQIQIGQPQMSLPAGGVVNVSSAPPSSQGQGLLMTTSSVVPVSPSSSSTTASQSIALHTSTAGINATSSSVVISGTSAPVLQGSKVQGQDGNSNSGPIFSSVTSSDASVIPIVPTSQMMTVTSNGDPSGANGAPIAVLNPQLQSQLSGQLSGSTAPILLTMNCNGQATSILVDPTTMHVLGTVQTQQPAAGQNSTPATSTSSTPPSKKGKKNPQRAICPKPQGNKAIGGAIPTSGATLLPAGLLVPTSAPTQGMWLTKEGEQPMDIVIPSQSTTTAPTKKAGNKSRSKSGKQKGNTENQGTTGAGSTQENAGASETDILAKAAESIFSSEISPGNFYNPANEDNPLQIDTSVGEGEKIILDLDHRLKISKATNRSPKNYARLPKKVTLRKTCQSCLP
ncbi:hypothetical protein FSP39_016472 [Pinctada imbricata]|uniref:BHLH domain-containing protein n=1 Tax=Pinctada imbricata TaxID=66713 RepID=A0AA89BPX6_PINIB|nr:hypothetical protein FSP39_016472 [Pinctada imbricata]